MFEKLKNFKKETIYLILALAFGLIMAVFNPPFAGVPDEHAHYWKASSIANGYWKCTGQDAIPMGAYNLPDNIKPQKIKGLDDSKIIVANLKKELLSKPSKEMAVIGASVCSASPAGYLPQSIGLKIGNLLGLSDLASFYLSRIFNLLAGVLIVYGAIRIVPVGKILLVVVGLLPMTMQQFASVGYDSLHISFILLFTAFVLRLALDEKTKINRSNIIILWLLSIFGLSIKPGYFMLSVLTFLIPREKFKNKTQYFFVCASIVLMSFLVFFMMRSVFHDSGDVFKDGVDPNSQIVYALSNPVQFANVVLETFYSKIIYFTETFLYKPGWLNNNLPPIFYIFTIAGLFLIVRNEDEDVQIKKWQRILLFGVFLANFLFIFLSLYAVWTKVGAGTIVGVQGRYFLSIAPLLLLSVYKLKFNFKFDFIRKNNTIFSVLFFIALSLFSLWFIFRIYYDKSGAGNEGSYVYVRQMNTEDVRKIAPVKIVGDVAQRFVAKNDYFSGVKLYVGDGLIVQDIVFELRDEDCQVILDKKNIKKNDSSVTSLDIKFAAKAGTKDKSLCLYSKDFYQSGLSPRIAAGAYNEGELNINGVKNSGNLVFDLIYKK